MIYKHIDFEIICTALPPYYLDATMLDWRPAKTPAVMLKITAKE